MQAGHFSETVLRYLQHKLTGSFTPFGTKIGNFIDECDRLTKQSRTTGPEGLRVIMPRALAFIYTLRSKRGFGHTGDDVDANAIDSGACVRAADWCLSELIRHLHQLPIEDAQAILDTISVRDLPAVWIVGERKRVLDQRLGYVDQTLLLLYLQPNASASADELFDWTDHSNKTRYTRGILRPLHKERFVEYDQRKGTVVLSPSGAKHVEDNVLHRKV